MSFFPLSTPLSDVPGLAGPLSARLAKLKIATVKDLLYYFPFRYQDFSTIKPITELQLNEVATIHGTIEKLSVSKTKWKQYLVITARIVDESGKAEAVWFNQRFLLNQLKEGLAINIAGKVSFSGKRAQFQSPEFEIISHDTLFLATPEIWYPST
jgi:ATP-dependent DNA helicase RecG